MAEIAIGLWLDRRRGKSHKTLAIEPFEFFAIKLGCELCLHLTNQRRMFGLVDQVVLITGIVGRVEELEAVARGVVEELEVSGAQHAGSIGADARAAGF